MNKKQLIQKIISVLTAELEASLAAAKAAHAEATHEQSKADNKYDTRGLEASYLARGQSRQVAESEEAILQYKKLHPRAFTAEEPIELAALVELESKAGKAVYFIGPCSGGTEVTADKKEILVITPQSPLGSQIMGRKQGEKLKLTIAGTQNDYRILSVT